MFDGSYRYCNKIACPRIQASHWTPETDLAQAPEWADVVAEGRTAVPQGPEIVNLAYDRTCNLSCPSCRTERFAATDAERAIFDRMQERAILPMLKNAKRVMVTGSGDPFASKNFRRLLEQLTPEEYPDLRFQVMTNGMLFTPAQWANFPTLHGRTAVLKISVDAATGQTHELLRRGAKWPVVLENMKFAGELTKAGLIDKFDLVFVVQAENFREMGAAVDLGHEVGATCVYFARITNWGTFTDRQYADKAVFLPTHPDHADFLAAMQDPRLRDPLAFLGDLLPFVDVDSEVMEAA
nr:radical SAM protein [Sphingomonas sp. ID1715]